MARLRIGIVAALGLGLGLTPLVAAPAGAVALPTKAVISTLDRMNNGLMLVPWAPSGGPNVTGWTATCTSSDGGAPETVNTDSSYLYMQFMPLTWGKHYTCSVHATNAAGDGPESDVSESLLIARIPDAPAHVVATGGNHEVTFDFDPPFDGGAPITKYTLGCSGGGLDPWGQHNFVFTSAPPLVVTGLANGLQLMCRVEAHNFIGSQGANSFDAYATPDTIPSIPAINAVTHHDASLTVAFTPNLYNTINVHSYTARCASSDGGVTRTATGTASPITVLYLTNTKTYTCTVHATNPKGSSDESSASLEAMPDIVPDAPLVDDATSGVNGKATVAFFAGPNNGSPVTSFTASCSSSNGGAAGAVSGSSSPLTVTGLTNGKSYTCTALGTNAEGDSAASAPSDAFVVGAKPAPSGPAKITGSVAALQTLTANAPWSGSPAPAVTRQWKRCDRSGQACVAISGATGATYTLTDADVGRTVRVTLTATNALGSKSVDAVSAVVATARVATAGPFYVTGGTPRRAGPGAVGASTYGATVWTATANGNVTGPRFGPGNGTLVGMRLTKPIIGIVAAPTGRGYWMFAGDGGVFSFGDAKFYGSTGALRLRSPIVSMATLPNGTGYWMFAADGGVFTFGAAKFYGSAGAQKLTAPIVAMLPSATGKGYSLVTRDGRALRFGDAPSIGDAPGRNDIVGLVSMAAGYRYVTSSLRLAAPH